jgi:hypothetical protein
VATVCAFPADVSARQSGRDKRRGKCQRREREGKRSRADQGEGRNGKSGGSPAAQESDRDRDNG